MATLLCVNRVVVARSSCTLQGYDVVLTFSQTLKRKAPYRTECNSRPLALGQLWSSPENPRLSAVPSRPRVSLSDQLKFPMAWLAAIHSVRVANTPPTRDAQVTDPQPRTLVTRVPKPRAQGPCASHHVHNHTFTFTHTPYAHLHATSIAAVGRGSRSHRLPGVDSGASLLS